MAKGGKPGSNKASTVFYYDWLNMFSQLTLEEVGSLTMAVLDYDKSLSQGTDYILPEFKDRAMKIAWSNMKNIIDRNWEEYKTKCQNNRDYGRQGGLKRVANANERNRTVANVADNDSDMDNDNDIDNVVVGDMECKNTQPTTTTQIDLAQIINVWNEQKCTNNISVIRSERLKNTRDSISLFGFNKFIETIKNLDNTGWLKDRDVDYNWFCNPDNLQKIIEGKYRTNYKKSNDIDWDSL